MSKVADIKTGKIYMIQQYQEFKDTSTFDKPNDITAGLISYFTSDGEIVNKIPNTETFQIFNTDIILRKV